MCRIWSESAKSKQKPVGFSFTDHTSVHNGFFSPIISFFLKVATAAYIRACTQWVPLITQQPPGGVFQFDA